MSEKNMDRLPPVYSLNPQPRYVSGPGIEAAATSGCSVQGETEKHQPGLIPSPFNISFNRRSTTATHVAAHVKHSKRGGG